MKVVLCIRIRIRTLTVNTSGAYCEHDLPLWLDGGRISCQDKHGPLVASSNAQLAVQEGRFEPAIVAASSEDGQDPKRKAEAYGEIVVEADLRRVKGYDGAIGHALGHSKRPADHHRGSPVEPDLVDDRPGRHVENLPHRLVGCVHGKAGRRDGAPRLETLSRRARGGPAVVGTVGRPHERRFVVVVVVVIAVRGTGTAAVLATAVPRNLARRRVLQVPDAVEELRRPRIGYGQYRMRSLQPPHHSEHGGLLRGRGALAVACARHGLPERRFLQQTKKKQEKKKLECACARAGKKEAVCKQGGVSTGARQCVRSSVGRPGSISSERARARTPTPAVSGSTRQ